MFECKACTYEVERTGLPVYCPAHAYDSLEYPASTLRVILEQLEMVEVAAAVRTMRAGLLEQQMLRTEAWKKGIIRA